MENAAERVWSSALQVLRSLLNQDIFNLWFAPIKAVSVENDALLLEVPNDFCEVWLKDNYGGLLRDALAQASGREMTIKFRAANSELRGGPVAGRAAAKEKLPANAAASASAAVAAGQAHTKEPAGNAENSFNPRNTFENFVVGDNNTFAHAAAMAVAQAPGRLITRSSSTEGWAWGRPICSMRSASTWPSGRRAPR